MAGFDPPAPSFPVYDKPVEITQQLLAEIDTRVTEFTGLANGAIAALEHLAAPVIPDAPVLPIGYMSPPTFQTFPPPNPQLFGVVAPITIPNYAGIDPEVYALAQQLIADVAKVPVFTPTVGAPNLPPAPPAPGDQSANLANLLAQRPAINNIPLPTAPNIYDPGPGQLVTIDIPVVPAITLPTFSFTVPTFDSPVPSGVLQWEEPTYVPTVRDEVVAAIKGMVDGSFAMPPAVQNALFGATRDRELMTTRKQVDEASSKWASNGWEMPPGMLVEEINLAEQSGALRENDRNRDVLQKAGDWANENLRQGVAQGIALEAQLISYFNSFAQRTFDGAKATLDSQRLLFDSRVGLFRAQNDQLNILCTVFDTEFKLAMAPLEIVRQELEVEKLKGTINQQTLDVYRARISAMQLLAQTFSTLMEGAKVQSEVQRDRVEAWKAEIDGFSAYLNALKIPYEIYDIEVRGEATKATVLEAQARAYAATVEGFTAGENVKIAVLQGELKAIDSSTQRFVATMGAQRDVAQAKASAISAEASAYSADVGRYGEQLKYAGTVAQVNVQSQEANLRNNLAYAEIKMHEYDAMAQRIIAIYGLQVEGIKAAGNIAAQLGAGAMSSQHVQASVSGSGSASQGSSYSYIESHSFDDTP